MSIFDNGPHTVSVQNMKAVRSAHGTSWEADGSPVDVKGSLQPLSAAESSMFDGVVAFTQKRFLCRSWPGTMHSVVTHGTDVYDCVGDPQHYNMAAATDHWEIVLRRRGDGQA